MSSLEQEIKSVVDAMVIPEPIFTLSVRTSSNAVAVKKQAALSNTSLSILSEMIMGEARLDWSPKDRRYSLRNTDFAEIIRHRLSAKMASVIYKWHGSKNPRLTSLYKWYNIGITSALFDKHPELQDVLFETWKYSQSNSMSDKSHRSNVLGILEVTKQKYERKRTKNGK
jgi:hypothetical protein